MQSDLGGAWMEALSSPSMVDRSVAHSGRDILLEGVEEVDVVILMTFK
jgi:hypothetical protein